MQPKYTKLLQIGILVRDLDAAVRHYEEELGIGPWEISYLTGDAPPMEDLAIDGVPRPEKVCKQAFVHIFGIELELIEPIAPSQYSRWLEEHGPGIHHIGVTMAEDYDEALRKYRERKGAEPWVRGTGLGGLMDFSYLDYREELGLIVECYRNIAPDRRGIPFDYQGVPADEKPQDVKED